MFHTMRLWKDMVNLVIQPLLPSVDEFVSCLYIIVSAQFKICMNSWPPSVLFVFIKHILLYPERFLIENFQIIIYSDVTDIKKNHLNKFQFTQSDAVVTNKRFCSMTILQRNKELCITPTKFMGAKIVVYKKIPAWKQDCITILRKTQHNTKNVMM